MDGLCVRPGAQSPGPQSQEDGADEFAKRGRVDGLQLVLVAVPQVMGVEGGTREAHPFGRLVIVNEPLNLLIQKINK